MSSRIADCLKWCLIWCPSLCVYNGVLSGVLACLSIMVSYLVCLKWWPVGPLTGGSLLASGGRLAANSSGHHHQCNYAHSRIRPHPDPPDGQPNGHPDGPHWRGGAGGKSLTPMLWEEQTLWEEQASSSRLSSSKADTLFLKNSS